jgi:DNA-binding GntR family transcriptional regulator
LAGPLPPIKHVEQQANVQVHHADQIMIPAVAIGLIARRLKIKAGTPVLRAIRVYYDADGNVLEMFDACYHPTNYRYTATLYPRAGSAVPSSDVPKRASSNRRQ